MSTVVLLSMIQLDSCLFYLHGFTQVSHVHISYKVLTIGATWLIYDGFHQEFMFDSAEACVSKLLKVLLSCIAACYCVFTCATLC